MSPIPHHLSVLPNNISRSRCGRENDSAAPIVFPHAMSRPWLSVSILPYVTYKRHEPSSWVQFLEKQDWGIDLGLYIKDL